MRIIIDGKLYDSTVTPILIVFDEGFEKETFKMNRFVSAPESSTVVERQKLIDTNINDFIDTASSSNSSIHRSYGTIRSVDNHG